MNTSPMRRTASAAGKYPAAASRSARQVLTSAVSWRASPALIRFSQVGDGQFEPVWLPAGGVRGQERGHLGVSGGVLRVGGVGEERGELGGQLGHRPSGEPPVFPAAGVGRGGSDDDAVPAADFAPRPGQAALAIAEVAAGWDGEYVVTAAGPALLHRVPGAHVCFERVH